MLLWPFWGGQRGREGGKGRDSRVIESRGPKGVKETEREGEHYLTFALRQVSRGEETTTALRRNGGIAPVGGALKRRGKSMIQLLVNHALRRAEQEPPQL